MTTGRRKVILCGICMAVMLAACGSGAEDDIQIVEQEDLAGQPETEETDVPEEEAGEAEEADGMPESGAPAGAEGKPAAVTIEKEEQEYKDGERIIMTTGFDNVSVTMEGNEAAAQAVMEEFEKRKQAFQESVEEELAAAKEYGMAEENGSSYLLEHGYTEARNDGRILSFSYLTGGYTGGAHGYYMTYGLNFDAKTGQVLSIADITEDKAAFQEICVQEMLRQCEDLKAQQILFDEDMIAPGLQEVLEGKMEGNEWYFTKDGIRFISNIYEIAPYAAGEIVFDIPYDMVNEVLKEGYRA